MIEIQIDPDQEELTVTIAGRLTSTDLEQLERVLGLHSKHGSGFNVVVELTDIKHLPLDEVKKGLEFSRAHSDKIRRMAVVMEDPYWRHVARLGGQSLAELLGVDAEDFREGNDARKWLTADET